MFADIDPLTFNIDPNQIEAKITPKTRAIMPVHLFGQCCDMDAIWDIAEEHAAVRRRGRGPVVRQRVPGASGAARSASSACLSFYPTKNLGALGDAGLVTTNDPDMDKKLRALRVHGSEVKYYHKYLGYNMRLDAIHAAMLRVKLPHVASWLNGREAAAQRYDALIESREPARLHAPAGRAAGPPAHVQPVRRPRAGERTATRS